MYSSQNEPFFALFVVFVCLQEQPRLHAHEAVAHQGEQVHPGPEQLPVRQRAWHHPLLLQPQAAHQRGRTHVPAVSRSYQDTIVLWVRLMQNWLGQSMAPPFSCLQPTFGSCHLKTKSSLPELTADPTRLHQLTVSRLVLRPPAFSKRQCAAHFFKCILFMTDSVSSHQRLTVWRSFHGFCPQHLKNSRGTTCFLSLVSSTTLFFVLWVHARTTVLGWRWNCISWGLKDCEEGGFYDTRLAVLSTWASFCSLDIE